MSGRTIRFRAWDITRKRMFPKVAVGEDGVITSVFAEFDAPSGWAPVPTALPLNIEQSTGLLDADNRDIYEGDIISFSTNGRAHGPEGEHVKGGVVWWDIEEAAFAFGRWTHPNCDEPFDYGYAPSEIRWSTVRVVGNIHEHSHLITP